MEPIQETASAKKPSLWRRLRAWWVRRRFAIQIGLAIFMLLFLYFWNNIVISVHSGELAVLWLRFFGGTVLDRTYGEGIHLIFPWDRMYIYDVRVQNLEDEFSVLTVDGLNVEVSISIRFRPVPETLGILHKNLGPDYIQKIISPEIQSVLRVIIGQLHPEEIFTTQRDILRTAIRESLLQMSEKNIKLDDLLIKKIMLPPKVKDAIESKLRQQQIALEYEYRLLEEEQEAKRKKIEAQGIRDFQDIVSDGISQPLLRWRGIEATLELAKSPNAKIVIIGGPQDGLPLILNTGDALSGIPQSASAAIPTVTEMIPSFNTNFNTSFRSSSGGLFH
ncbi:MAG: prohibitin family protein [Candidatus Omnitrophota bacterium]